MRNPNGFGSVYKLTGNRRRPWIARVTVGWDGEKQLFQTLGYFAKRQDAMAALADYHRNPMPRATITLGALYEEWAEQKYLSGISKSMVDGYKAAWKHLSRLEKVTMREMRTKHMQDIINDAYGAGLSKSSLQKIRTLCAQLFEYALEHDIAPKDYSQFIKLPKFENDEKERYTDLEIKRLWDSVHVPWVDTILMLIYTGFRINEFLALTRFSVDLEQDIIRGGSKTQAGKNRIVPIHPRIRPLIVRRYNENGDYLITLDGKKLSARKYREDIYRPTLAKVGVRVLNPHACRHTCASLLYAAGVGLKERQKILGHVDVETTTNYTHVDIQQLHEAMRKVPGQG